MILTMIIENARGDTGSATGIAIDRLYDSDAFLKDGAHYDLMQSEWFGLDESGRDGNCGASKVWAIKQNSDHVRLRDENI